MSRLNVSPRWRRSPIALAVAAAVAGMTQPAPAGAASFVADAPLRPFGRAILTCLQSSPDGSLVSWRDRKRTIRAGSLRDAAQAPTVGSADYCPTAAVAADGSAAVASQTVDRDNNSGVQLALRPAGGAFAQFAPLAVPAVFSEGSGLALGGGVVAMGVGRQQGDRALPVLLIRAADGSVRSVSLPGGVGGAKTREDLVGPLAVVDGAGRGLVIWGATRAVGGQLLAARFDGSSALGPVQVLAADGVENTFTEPSVAVGPDGATALAWVGGHRTTVLTGTTTGGFDLATATSTPLDWVVSVAPDGAAVAVDSSSNGERGRVRIATRAAGQPFSAARTYRTGDFGDEQPALAVHDGRYLVAFAAQPMMSTELGLLEAVTGHAGERPGPAVTIPISSARVPNIAATLPPNGPPTVLTTTQRSTDCVDCHSLHDRFEIDAFHFSTRPPRQPRGVSARLALNQRLGHPQTVRVRVTCPRICAVRVVGSVTAEEGEFDTSRTLRPGTTVLRVPYASGGGSAPSMPLRRARRTRLGIAIDDATGELLLHRTVVVRP